MKNIFILFIFIIGAFYSNCRAETLPSTSIIPIENAAPIHYAYAKDYFDKLYEKFDGKSLGILGDYSIAYVDIDKSGEILDIRGFDYITSPFFGFKLRKLLRDNPPPPFYEGMESEKIKIEISIYTLIDEQQSCSYMHDEKGLYKKACLTMHTANPEATLYGGEIFQYRNRASWYADVHQKFNISLEKCVKTR